MHSLLHFLTKSIQSAARSRERRKREGGPVGRQQWRQLLSIRTEEHRGLGLGSSGGHGLKTHVQREAEFQNAPFIDANKGRTVDMTGGRVFGLHQNGVPVAGGLQKGDEVFARSCLLYTSPSPRDED